MRQSYIWNYLNNIFIDEILYSVGNLNSHIRNVHEKIKNHTCSSCGKQFNRLDYLKKHIDIVHNGIKPFNCKSCPKAFATNTEHNEHLKLMHGDQFGDLNDSGKTEDLPGKWIENYKMHFVWKVALILPWHIIEGSETSKSKPTRNHRISMNNLPPNFHFKRTENWRQIQ